MSKEETTVLSLMRTSMYLVKVHIMRFTKS